MTTSTTDLAKRYEEGASLTVLSAESGIAVSTIRCRLVQAGVALRTRTEGIRVAAAEGRLGRHLAGKKREFTNEWRRNISRARLDHSARCARGTRTTPSGYLEFTKGPNKGRLVHVVLMEERIGRRITVHECVHHMDENKLNNDITNLQLMTRSDHARHHAEENAHKRERDTLGRFK